MRIKIECDNIEQAIKAVEEIKNRISDDPEAPWYICDKVDGAYITAFEEDGQCNGGLCFSTL